MVYALIIPSPNLPEYTGEWLLWFAEKTPGSAAGPMRAPLPRRKLEPMATAGGGIGSKRRVVVALTVDRDGKVRIGDDQVEPVPDEVLSDLRAWDFQPAVRGGAPVAAD